MLGPWGLSNSLSIFCRIAAAQGQPVRAVRLGAAAVAVCATHHTPLVPLYEALLEEGLALAGRALGPAARAGAWAGGEAMSLQEAIAESFAVEVAPPPAPARRPPRPSPARR